MSVDLGKPGERMALVNKAINLTYGERVFLSWLAYRDGPGGATPGYPELMRVLGVDKRGPVSNFIKQLEKKGVLSHIKRPGKVSLYKIHYSSLEIMDYPDNDDPSIKSKQSSLENMDYYPSRNYGHEPEYIGKEPESIPPVSPLTAQGGRRRKRRQGTLDITAEGVAGFLNNHEVKP